MTNTERQRQDEIDKYIKVYAKAPHYGSHGELLRGMIDDVLFCLSGDSLIDLSCGRGAAMAIADRYFKRVRGTETVPALLGPRVRFAMAHDLPIPDKSFDVVMSTGVLEHLLPDDTYPALAEMKRVATRTVFITLNNRPGHFHINTPSYSRWNDIFLDVFDPWQVHNLGDMGNDGENRAWLIVAGTG